jgi:hypothetical protein
MFSLAGIALSLASAAFVVYLAIRRLIVGPEAEGLFTLFEHQFPPDRHSAVRHRLTGRVRRADLSAGAGASALHHPRRFWKGEEGG